jgi:hypothetical protein
VPIASAGPDGGVARQFGEHRLAPGGVFLRGILCPTPRRQGTQRGQRCGE